MSSALVDGNFADALWFLLLILSFIFGSFVSGYTTGDNKFRLGRAYGNLLLLESCALFVVFFLLKYEVYAAVFAAAFACGLQNAMATSYSGAALRTTHVTGMCTDVGVLLGQLARKNPSAERWRLRVFLPLMGGYTLGGLTGYLAFAVLGAVSILIPTMLTGLAAVFYLTWGTVKVAADAFAKALDGLHILPDDDEVELTSKKEQVVRSLLAAPIIQKYLATPSDAADIDRNIAKVMEEFEATLKAAMQANAQDGSLASPVKTASTADLFASPNRGRVDSFSDIIGGVAAFKEKSRLSRVSSARKVERDQKDEMEVALTGGGAKGEGDGMV